ILLLFIYTCEPIKKLIVPSLNFKVLKQINVYVYVLLFFALDWIICSYVLAPLFPHAGEEQYIALDFEILEKHPIL
ncbi:hypothetical protein, partial [Streptococcus sobrinus]